MKNTILKAFHNITYNKENVLSQLKDHHKEDEIIKGTYWKDGKGCAVGCTVHSANHKCYEKELGIPEWLARLEDYLFENLPNKQAKEFPILFIESIPVGFDNWIKIYHNFYVYLLTDIIKTEKDTKIIKAVKNIITLHIKAAKGEIESNLLVAESVVWHEARLAVRTASRSAGWSATWSVVWSVEESVARTPEASVAWHVVRTTGGSLVWCIAIVKITEKLLELLEAEKRT